jgi:hypothetical protein
MSTGCFYPEALNPLHISYSQILRIIYLVAMATPTVKSIYPVTEIQSIGIEKDPNPETDTTLPPPQGIEGNDSEVEPTTPVRVDGEDNSTFPRTVPVQRRILEMCYLDLEFPKMSVKRFENLSLANIRFYENELNKLEREIIIMNMGGNVEESLIQKLYTLMKEYRM